MNERRMKRSALGLVVLLGILAVSAVAAPAWYTCTVDMAGSGGSTYIMLTDVGGSFSRRWVVADTAQANRMLATALMAIQGKSQVTVAFDPALTWPTLAAIYVNAN